MVRTKIRRPSFLLTPARIKHYCQKRDLDRCVKERFEVYSKECLKLDLKPTLDIKKPLSRTETSDDPVDKKLMEEWMKHRACLMKSVIQPVTTYCAVNKVQVRGLVDTGSSITAISEVMYNKLVSAGKAEALTAWDGGQVLSADNLALKINGKASAAITIGTYSFSVDVAVMPGLFYNLMLGVDVLKAHNAVISFERGTLHFGADSCVPIFTNKSINSNIPESDNHVIACAMSTVVVGPREEVMLAHFTGRISTSTAMAVPLPSKQPTRSMYDSGILAGHSQSHMHYPSLSSQPIM
jgi:hypothetical protein